MRGWGLSVGVVCCALAVWGSSAGAEQIDTTPTCRGVPATIVGTAGDDVLEGTQGDDVIVALGGDDVVRGLGGDDLICGNGGNDRLIGGRGNDEVRGGPGNDRLRGGSQTDIVAGGPGDDLLLGGNGRQDQLRGGPGHDRCFDPRPQTAVARCEVRSGDAAQMVSRLYRTLFGDLTIAGSPTSSPAQKGAATNRLLDKLEGDRSDLEREIPFVAALTAAAELTTRIDQPATITYPTATIRFSVFSFENPTQLSQSFGLAVYENGRWKIANEIWEAFLGMAGGGPFE